VGSLLWFAINFSRSNKYPKSELTEGATGSLFGLEINFDRKRTRQKSLLLSAVNLPLSRLEVNQARRELRRLQGLRFRLTKIIIHPVVCLPSLSGNLGQTIEQKFIVGCLRRGKRNFFTDFLVHSKGEPEALASLSL
jgi:hypothetical protein